MELYRQLSGEAYHNHGREASDQRKAKTQLTSQIFVLFSCRKIEGVRNLRKVGRELGDGQLTCAFKSRSLTKF